MASDIDELEPLRAVMPDSLVAQKQWETHLVGDWVHDVYPAYCWRLKSNREYAAYCDDYTLLLLIAGVVDTVVGRDAREWPDIIAKLLDGPFTRHPVNSILPTAEEEQKGT